MANVDQKKYLKKYLDDDHSKKRKKKKRSHSGSYSDRVKIIDDDGEHRRKRNYDDENDLMLTGEDAPQIVGMVDDRPPELKAAEDFRNNSKWKSIPSSSADDRSRNNDRHRDEHRKQYERRSRTPPRKDSSPKRVPDRSKETSSAAAVTRRRHDSDDDYSPARRRREPEKPKPSASYVKSEKRTYQDSEQTYKRDTGGKDYRNYDRGQDKRYEGSSSSNHRRYLTPPPQDTARRDATHLRTENGRSKDHYQSRDNSRNEYLRQPPVRESRVAPPKFNPFRANPVVSQSQSNTSQHHDSYRRTSPAKNPFRAKPPPSLSPLPDRRGGGGGDERSSSRPQKPAETYRSRFESSTHTSSGFNGNSSAHHSVNRKPFNPFKADVKLRDRSPLPPSQGSRNSKDSGRGRDENNYNRRLDNAQTHRDSHFRAERSAASERSSHATRFRSRSPLKSEVKSFVSQSFRPVEKSKFDSTDRTASKQNYDWHAAQSDSTRKPLSSAVADVRHRLSSDYPSSTTTAAPVRKSRWEGSTHERR